MNPSDGDDGHHHQQQDGRGDEGRSSSDRKPERRFPWTLHRLLEEAEREGNQHIVSWMPSGNAFIVHKRDVFMTDLLPRYFRQTKFKSFVRQLNLWGFTFIDHGPDKGSYFNEHFVKGKPSLCYDMRRLKVKGGISNAAVPTVARGASRSRSGNSGRGGNLATASLPPSLAIASSHVAAVDGGYSASPSAGLFPPSVQQSTSSIQVDAMKREQHGSTNKDFGRQSPFPALSVASSDLSVQLHPQLRFAQATSNQIQGLAMPTRHFGPITGLQYHESSMFPPLGYRHQQYQQQFYQQVIPDPNFLHCNRGNHPHPSGSPSSSTAGAFSPPRGTPTDGRIAHDSAVGGNTTSSALTNREDWFDRLEAVYRSPGRHDVPEPAEDAGTSSTGGGSNGPQHQHPELRLQSNVHSFPGSPSIMSSRGGWPDPSDLEPRPFRSSEGGGGLRKRAPLLPPVQVGKPKLGGDHDEEAKDIGLDPRQWGQESGSSGGGSGGGSMGRPMMWPRAQPPPG